MCAFVDTTCCAAASLAPAFTTSLRPFTAFRRLDLDGPSQYPVLSTPLLNDSDHNTLAAYAEAIIAPGDRVPEADEETVNRVLETLPYMPSNLRTIYRGLLRTLDASAFTGKSVTVRFVGTEDSSLGTSFVVDDTALTTS